MGQGNALSSIGMAVSAKNVAWVDAYLACGCATSDDNPILNVSGWKGVREFSSEAK